MLFIRNQIHRIGVYPYPISPPKAYPDNPCARVAAMLARKQRTGARAVLTGWTPTYVQ